MSPMCKFSIYTTFTAASGIYFTLRRLTKENKPKHVLERTRRGQTLYAHASKNRILRTNHYFILMR